MSSSEDILLSDIATVAAASAEFLDAMAIQLPPGKDRDLFQRWADANRKISQEQEEWVSDNFDAFTLTDPQIVEAYKDVTIPAPIEVELRHTDDLDGSKIPNLGLFG